MKTFFSIVFTIAIFQFFSCKKEKTNVAPGKEPIVEAPVDIEMLRICKPNWLIYKVMVGSTDFWPIPGIFETCMKDDTYKFYKDSVLTTFENKMICSGNSDSSHSSWNFVDGRKKIAASFFGTTDTADIVLLTDSTMQLFVNYNGTDATIHFKK
jgi:hypothetical protein